MLHSSPVPTDARIRDEERRANHLGQPLRLRELGALLFYHVHIEGYTLLLARELAVKIVWLEDRGAVDDQIVRQILGERLVSSLIFRVLWHEHDRRPAEVTKVFDELQYPLNTRPTRRREIVRYEEEILLIGRHYAKIPLNATSLCASGLFLSMLEIFFLTLLTILLPLSGSAQEPIKGYYPYEYKGLPYRMWGDKGDGPEPYSVVIYLHGAGEKGNNNERQILQGSDIIDTVTSYLDRTQKRCLVIVPQCPWDKQWVNADWTLGSYNSEAAGFTPELQKVIDLLRDLQDRRNINAKEIYLMGASMGAFGVWDLLQRVPDLFAAAVPICGAADTSRASQIAKTPVWTFHAEGDMVVPVSGSREIVQRLQALGAPIKYTEYTFEPHIVWPRVAREPGLLDWMFSNIRSEASVVLKPYESSVLSYNVGEHQLSIDRGDWLRASLLLHDHTGREIFSTVLARDHSMHLAIHVDPDDERCFYTLTGDNGKIERGKLLISY
jgi:predicted esterase